VVQLRKLGGPIEETGAVIYNEIFGKFKVIGNYILVLMYVYVICNIWFLIWILIKIHILAERTWDTSKLCIHNEYS